MYRFLLLCCLTFIFTPIACAQKMVKIGLYDNAKSAHITNYSSIASIQLDSNDLIRFQPTTTVKLTYQSGRIVVYLEDSLLGIAKSVHVMANDSISNRPFQLVCKDRTRKYPSDFLLQVVSGGGFNVIQYTDIQNYLEGVLEAELGHNRAQESYRAQAIISRTYLLANWSRHASQGYSLCNEQHCQVYVGTDKVNMEVHRAIASTKNMVLLDASDHYVNAVFHANCGGATANSEEVWGGRASCLRAVTDPYCSNGLAYKWTKELDAEEFYEYLKRHSQSKQLSIADSINVTTKYRKKDLKWKDVSISYAQIKSDFGLRSSLFSVVQKGRKVYLQGRGWGHGVGLCQEGAATMGKKGMNYQKILKHYYKGSRITTKHLDQDI